MMAQSQSRLEQSPKSLSQRRQEQCQRDDLISEICTSAEKSTPEVRWISDFRENLGLSTLSNLSDLRQLLEDKGSKELRSALASVRVPSKRKKRRSDSAPQTTTSANQLRAKQRKGRDCPEKVQRQTKSQLEDLIAAQRYEIADLKFQLETSGQHGQDCPPHPFATEGDSRRLPDAGKQPAEARELALGQVQTELQDVIVDTGINMQQKEVDLVEICWEPVILSGPVRDQDAFQLTAENHCHDTTLDLAIACEQPWSGQLADLSPSLASTDFQYVQFDAGSTEMDGDGILWPLGPPRCCGSAPMFVTNADCQLCERHCPDFTWQDVTSIGTAECKGVCPCPACGGPGCVTIQRRS